jgi:hypothetical protein
MLSPLRMPGPQTLASINDYNTLVPYPRIHAVLPSFAKFTPESSFSTSGENTTAELFYSLFSKET